MEYQDIFSINFIQEFNHVLGKNVIIAKETIEKRVDVPILIQRAGYKIRFIDGKTDSDLDTTDRIVMVNPQLPKTRQRYWLAHQLGNIVQAQTRNYTDGSNVAELDEAFSSDFASQILMPKKLVSDAITLAIGKLNLDARNIQNEQLEDLLKEAANQLEVSTDALTIRTSRLNLFKRVS